ncbi:MAG: aspartate aminotransferase family protein [Geminicoccaceae bacterium]|nr:MAG: aspartate aminotransferase family protein [Geminicoccaceae bacterium]
MRNAAIPAVMPNYNRLPVAFDRGRGCELWDAAGRRWLDLTAGIAVVGLGHCHPHLTAALTDQAEQLWHTSNLYRISELERLSERLVARTFAETVLLTNSGAEALEGCIKLARRHFHVRGLPQRNRIVTFEGAFHGRTMATISAAGGAKMVDGFAPLLEGFDRVPWGDHEALHQAVGPNTAAILIEPIQGEGGIREVPIPCLKGLRDLCDREGILLMFDEVQCGVGRTGTLFVHEQAGISPDVMAVAKGIGNGFPVGAVLATAHAAQGLTPGTHGSTYAGNPLAARVCNAVLDVMLAPEFLPRVQAAGERLEAGLRDLTARHPGVFAEVRGRGLMLGLKLQGDALAFNQALFEAGLLLVPAAENVLRLLPPLVISDAEIDEALTILDATARKTTP